MFLRVDLVFFPPVFLIRFGDCGVRGDIGALLLFSFPGDRYFKEPLGVRLYGMVVVVRIPGDTCCESWAELTEGVLYDSLVGDPSMMVDLVLLEFTLPTTTVDTVSGVRGGDGDDERLRFDDILCIIP